MFLSVLKCSKFVLRGFKFVLILNQRPFFLKRVLLSLFVLRALPIRSRFVNLFMTFS